MNRLTGTSRKRRKIISFAIGRWISDPIPDAVAAGTMPSKAIRIS